MTTAATHLEKVEAPGAMLSNTAAKALAILRITTGFLFLWAFLDKTFGLGYATPTSRAWINGGSPTKGFLANVNVGPLDSTFHSIAGHAWADWFFMTALLAIGLALILGIGLRITAAAATALLALMWLAEWPPATTTDKGQPTGSNNPITDDHVLYAITTIALALTYAGHTWGFGKWWTSLPLVQKHRWLI